MPESCRRFLRQTSALQYTSPRGQRPRGLRMRASDCTDTPNRAFLTRLEIGEMRDSVVKSFVSETDREANMLWTIFVVLLVLWLLGFSLHIGGALIHLLLVVGLVVLVINLLSGRRSAV